MFRCPSDPDRAFSPRQGRCSIPDRSPRPSPAMCSRCRERQRGTYGRSALRVSHTRSVRFRPAYPHEFAYPGRGGSLSHILYAHSAVIPCSTPRCAWPCTAGRQQASRPEALRCGSLCAQLSPVPDTLAGEPWATPRAVSPVEDGAGTSAKELEHWGSALGHHLAAHGSTGPYGIDATWPRTAGCTPRGWSRAQHGFADAVGLLRAGELAWESSPRKVVVLHADAPADRRSWRYAVIGANRASVTELEAALRNVMKPEVVLG